MMAKFDAETVLRMIAEHRVTHAQFVPTMFVRMLKLPAAVRESTTCRACGASSTRRRRARSTSNVE